MITVTKPNRKAPLCAILTLLLFISVQMFGQEHCYKLPTGPSGPPPEDEILTEIPKINTYPQAEDMVYFLDSWQGGAVWYAEPAAITGSQAVEIMRRLGEDWQFNVNWTTDSTVYHAANPLRRMRIIVTPTNGWRPGVGGISYTGSFTWGETQCCAFVFSNMLFNDAGNIAECASHEAGHTAGLTHQSDYDANCNMTNHYSAGNGFWATIMGNSYGRTQTTFHNGPTPFGCNVTQEAIPLMMSQNGFEWRPRTSENINLTAGVTLRTLNIRQFRIDSIRLQVNTPSLIQVELESGGNTDIAARIQGQLYNTPNVLSLNLSATLQNGNTWLEVFGDDNPFSPSNYGSFGTVKMKITTTPLSTTPITQDNPRPVTRLPDFRTDQNYVYFRMTAREDFALYAVNGQFLMKGQTRIGLNVIPIAGLPSGVYVLKTEYKGSQQFVK
jgi:hypothetical protein